MGGVGRGTLSEPPPSAQLQAGRVPGLDYVTYIS